MPPGRGWGTWAEAFAVNDYGAHGRVASGEEKSPPSNTEGGAPGEKDNEEERAQYIAPLQRKEHSQDWLCHLEEGGTPGPKPSP